MNLGGYSQTNIEKIRHLSDILQKIGQLPFLRTRLSLYGGTALNLLRLPATYRLSVDVDFNYREPPNSDWGKERDVIDSHLKNILIELGYMNEAIKVQPSYPLSRLETHYTLKQGTNTSVKIETGYLRRIPILRNDELCTYVHPITNFKTKILTPQVEELFANKFCTMLSRSKITENARDLFDVWVISKQDFNKELFMDVIFIESLLMKLDFKNTKKISTKKAEYENLRTLIRPGINLEMVFNEAREFTSSTIEEALQTDWQTFIHRFNNEKTIPHDLLNKSKEINPEINQHPTLKRILQK
jgi:predicted nucleotidyltransferase component of viral defense system